MFKLFKTRNNEKIGLIFAILSSLFVSIEILIIDFLYQNNPQINFFEMLFWSYFGVIMFGSLIFLSSKKSFIKVKKTFQIHKKLLIKDSFLSIIAVSFYFLGINLVGSSTSSLFSRASIIFSIMLSVIILKEKVSIKEFFLILLMIIGFLFYQNNYSFNSIFGIIIVLCSTFSYSLISYFIKKENNDANSLDYSYLRQIFVLILNILLYVFIYRFYLDLHFIGWTNFLLLTFGSFFGSILSRTTSMIAIDKIELHKYAVVKNLDVFFVIIGSYLLFGQTYSYLRLFGVGLVFISILIYAFGKRIKKSNFHH